MDKITNNITLDENKIHTRYIDPNRIAERINKVAKSDMPAEDRAAVIDNLAFYREVLRGKEDVHVHFELENKLTQEQRDYYIRRSGRYCPHCESTNIKKDAFEINREGQLISWDNCLECKNVWMSVYDISGVLGIPRCDLDAI